MEYIYCNCSSNKGTGHFLRTAEKQDFEKVHDIAISYIRMFDLASELIVDLKLLVGKQWVNDVVKRVSDY